MTSRYTLDRRPVLYGERRLSDPQVRALETAASGPLVYQHGFYAMHGPETVRALNNQWLVRMEGDRAVITERGLEILAAIRGVSS